MSQWPFRRDFRQVTRPERTYVAQSSVLLHCRDLGVDSTLPWALYSLFAHYFSKSSQSIQKHVSCDPPVTNGSFLILLSQVSLDQINLAPHLVAHLYDRIMLFLPKSQHGHGNMLICECDTVI